MTDAELDLLERRARDFLELTQAVDHKPEYLDRRGGSIVNAGRVIAGDAVRAVDMVRAERSARRSIQEQRDAALERILASNPQEGA